jgi:hypothetical protein
VCACACVCLSLVHLHQVLLLLRTKPEGDGAALSDFTAAFRCDELLDQPPCRRDALMQQRLARAPRDGNGDPVRKTPLLEQFIYINDYFTKTGSGQT